MNARDDQRLALAGTKPAQEGRAGQGASAPPARSQARASAARQRKLHVGHFAFMRSVVQGLDPRESWERYLRSKARPATSARCAPPSPGFARSSPPPQGARIAMARRAWCASTPPASPTWP